MPWTEADLNRLIADAEPESNVLEFKGAGSLAKKDNERKEIAKDVSAMANSAGGTIVYGIAEGGDGVAGHIDGIDPTIFNRDWLDSVIKGKIQPPIPGVVIDTISLSDGKVAFAVHIPQAMTLAPHMAADNRYWWRSNGSTSPMEDFQVRDVMRRATTPELFANVKAQGPFSYGEFKRMTIDVEVGNRANVPCLYSTVTVGCASALLNQTGQERPWTHGQPFMDGSQPMAFYEANLAAPNDQPLYPGRMTRIRSLFVMAKAAPIVAPFGYQLVTPGFHFMRTGRLVWSGPEVILDWD